MQTLSVTAGVAWPSIRCTMTTLAPACTAREAALCRSPCGGDALYAGPLRRASNTRRRNRPLRSIPPRGAGNMRSSAERPPAASLAGRLRTAAGAPSVARVLRGADRGPAPDLRHRPLHMQTPPHQVAIPDLQRDHLAPAQTRVGQDADEVAVVTALPGQALHFLVAQEALGPDSCSRQRHPGH